MRQACIDCDYRLNAGEMAGKEVQPTQECGLFCEIAAAGLGLVILAKANINNRLAESA